MTDEQREKAVAAFKSKSKREQIMALEKLSEPWIKQGAISSNAKSIEEILELMDKSKVEEIKVEANVKTLFRRSHRGPNTTQAKKRRKK